MCEVSSSSHSRDCEGVTLRRKSVDHISQNYVRLLCHHRAS